MKSILFWVVFTLISFGALAQKFTLSPTLQLSVPQGEYKTTNSDLGFGLRLNALYRPSEMPVKVGIDIGMQERGRATQYFSGYVYGSYDDFRVDATNNIVSLMFLIRFQSAKPQKIKPFLDVTGGWNVFFSTVEVERLTFYSSYNSSYSNSSKAHWAVSYGGAGGLDISLNKRNEIGLELKVGYLIGTYTRYLTNPYIDGNGDASFEEKSSRTDMLIPQVGVRINLN
ncbi:MAG: hypothetical protein ABI288_09150 [Ginsengibacter sp.]